jgi:hypothetical protein
MDNNQERQWVMRLAIILLVIGIASYVYAAWGPDEPEEPIRVMFKNIAGNVIFDHETHKSDAGYGVACLDCHHHPMEDELDTRVCRECHQTPTEEEPFATACMDCHDEDEIEDTEMISNKDAIHDRCTDCHLDYEAGPLKDDCYSCHFK